MNNLQLLINLQHIDRLILEKLYGSDVSHTKTEQDNLDPISGLLKHKRSQCVMLKKRYETVRAEIEDINRTIKVVKRKKSLIKTNIEFHKYTEEIKKLSDAKERLEDDLKKTAEIMTEAMMQLGALEQQDEDKRRLLATQNRKSRDYLIKSQKELFELLKKRDEIERSIDVSLYELYMDLMNCNKGLAVVKAVKKICTGCNILLPGQFFADIIEPNGLVQCPGCMRILYRDDHSFT